MNCFKKFYPNVFVAECTEMHKKGELIEVTTKHGKVHKCIIYNLVGVKGTKDIPLYWYSVTREDGFNSQERAKNKFEKLNNFADNAQKRGEDWQEKSNEGKDFLILGEPIKIGHHSEKRHRALIERNWNRMSNAMEEYQKSEDYRTRAEFWEKESKKINLSMPESLDFYEIQLKEAIAFHEGLKKGLIKKDHSFSVAYANKKVKDLKLKYEIAQKLWSQNG